MNLGLNQKAIGDWTPAQLQQFIQTQITDPNANQTQTGLNGKIDKPSPPPNTAGQALVWDGGHWTASSTPSLPQPGFIVMTATATAPTGWFLCNGQAVSRTLFAALFTAIGTTYGVGDGSTTFNVPDVQGRVPIGAGSGAGLTARTLAVKGGAETVSISLAHTHSLSDAGQAAIFIQATGTPNLFTRRGSSQSWTANLQGDATTVASNTSSFSAGAALLGNTDSATPSATPSIVQPFLVLNYLIKT